MNTITGCCPVADRIGSTLAEVEDLPFDDTAWVDAEFFAIVAGLDLEPPGPPQRPCGRPARWNGPPRGGRADRDRHLEGRIVVSDQQSRQRSPPLS